MDKQIASKCVSDHLKNIVQLAFLFYILIPMKIFSPVFSNLFLHFTFTMYHLLLSSFLISSNLPLFFFYLFSYVEIALKHEDFFFL